MLSYFQESLGIRMEGKDSATNPYQENSFFFVGVICLVRAVKGELQHPGKL
jgi:hypothetical protein